MISPGTSVPIMSQTTLIIGLCRIFSCPSFMKTSYRTSISTQLEYAAPSWGPGTCGRIHPKFLRTFSTSCHHTASITSMKASQSLPNISLRRRISCLCFFCKIYHVEFAPTLCVALQQCMLQCHTPPSNTFGPRQKIK